MDKVEIYNNIINTMCETYRAKNSDYGDSVGDTYNKFGDVSFLTRITDNTIEYYHFQIKVNVAK
jgi:hypothetical protein